MLLDPREQTNRLRIEVARDHRIAGDDHLEQREPCRIGVAGSSFGFTKPTRQILDHPVRHTCLLEGIGKTVAKCVDRALP